MQKDLVFVNRDIDAEADVFPLIFSNHANGSRIKLFPQFSDEQMCIITTQVVKDDRDVVGNGIPKVALLMSSASVFSGVMAVISDYCVPLFEAF